MTEYEKKSLKINSLFTNQKRTTICYWKLFYKFGPQTKNYCHLCYGRSQFFFHGRRQIPNLPKKHLKDTICLKAKKYYFSQKSQKRPRGSGRGNVHDP